MPLVFEPECPWKPRERIVQDFFTFPRRKTAKTLILVRNPGIVVSDQIRCDLSQPLPSGSSIPESQWETRTP